MRLVVLTLGPLLASASVFHRTGDDASRYTIRGADRGYTEADSLLASEYLQNTIIRSDHHPLSTNECVYAHVNTTVISLCNGSARNRTVNRAEARRGIDQLIKDCGLKGGFTGLHVVNNLTFSAYGATCAQPPPPKPKPNKITSFPRPKITARDDCSVSYNGIPRTDCDWKNKIKDGKCSGDYTRQNDCQVFCELKRTGFYGREDRSDGPAGTRSGPGVQATIANEESYSVSKWFSIGADGVAKEAIGAGVGYQWSTTVTKGKSIERTSNETSQGFYSRWVFFPKQIESCGTIGRMSANVPAPCMGDNCVPESGPECTGEIETIENVCSLVPHQTPDGQPDVDWAIRFENDDGTVAPYEKQPASYRRICNREGNPDGDPEKECYNWLEGSESK